MSPSGEQWTLRHGRQEATVVEVGGGLRTYTVDGVDVVAGYAEDEFCLAGRGQVLMPWPNRIRGGRYSFDGVDHQLAITEIPLSNSNHGLVRWQSWHLVDQSQEEATLVVGTRLHPSPGWDGTLDLRVTYALLDDGLHVTAHATNVGGSPVPFGYGAHPYIALNETRLADVELTIPAANEVLVDAQMIPSATEAVRPEMDFRTTRALGDTSLDTAYTALERTGRDGEWEVVVGGLATGEVRVWGDRSLDWAQVFTAKGADTGVKGTRGIAVEPMSCPSNAFNSGDGLVVLEPGQDWSGSWGIRPSQLA